MSEIERLRSLPRSRQDPPIHLDVTAAVLGEIAARREMSPSSALGAMAAGSCAAAAMLAAIAWQMWSALSDPLAQFFGSMTGVMQ